MADEWMLLVRGELQGAGQQLTDAVRAAVEQALATSAEAWPRLALPEETFVRHLLAHWSRSEPLADYLTAVHAADMYLAAACLEGRAEALTHFDAAYLAQVPAYLARFRPDPAFAADVRQAVAEKLFVGPRPRIGEYAGRAPLGGWLRVVSVRVALDLMRGPRTATTGGAQQEAAAGGAVEPELDYLRERYRAEFAEAFEVAVAGLPVSDRQLLKMYFVDRVQLNEVAARLGKSRMTVLRRVAAARQAIREHAQRRLTDRLKLSASEFQSVFRLVRSQLDLSIATLLDR
jgi:RNA polymerase sigma-70 factor (ECF subfamily)